jgi:hypothetical protein
MLRAQSWDPAWSPDGTSWLPLRPTRGDSGMARRWRRARLVIRGNTIAPAFAGDFTTEPLARGATRNSWDNDRTAGGSSGGASAAVASGMVPLAHGADLGGSIRIPTACCGVFVLKRLVGLNPLGPHWEEIAGGLDADHVLARSARDGAAALDFSAGPATGAEPRPDPSATRCDNGICQVPGLYSSVSRNPYRNEAFSGPLLLLSNPLEACHAGPRHHCAIRLSPSAMDSARQAPCGGDGRGQPNDSGGRPRD